MRTLIALAVGLTLVTGTAAAQDSTAADRQLARARREAASLLQGLDTGFVLPEGEIDRLSRVLVRIRDTFPELADVSLPAVGKVLEVYLSDSGRAAVLAAAGAVPDTGSLYAPLPRSGLPLLDSLNARFHAAEVVAMMSYGRPVAIYVRFDTPMNMSALDSAYGRVPGVEFAGAPLLVGGGSHIRYFAKPDADLFVFARGGGDCPSGCTEWDYYYIAHSRVTGKLRKEREILHASPVAQREPIHLWDYPSRLTLEPYRSYRDLIAATRRKRWWERHHAFAVLGFLLRPGTERLTTEWDSELRMELDAAAEADREGALAMLLACAAGDPDADVRRTCADWHASLAGATP